MYLKGWDWVQRGSDIPVSFSNGDRFGAQATSSGQVKVYKNSTLLATVDVTAWPYYASGGYVGLWTIEASGSLLDDFGGGTIPQGRAPGWNLASLLDGVKALLRAPVAWVSQLFGGAKQAALVPVKIHAEELQTETPPPAGQIWKNYILAGGQRIAMREYTATNPTGTVYFLLGDHLGSTTVVVNAATGDVVGQIRYSAYGEERYTSDTTPTNYRYTGQLSKVATIGLYFYGSRWMDPNIMQFNQPDTLIPDPYNVLDWSRYSYARFNPLRYTDPSGHVTTDECGPDGIYCENKKYSQSSIAKIFKTTKERRAAARTIATFIEDPGYFLDLYMDPGNAWGKSDDVAYLNAYAEYGLGMSAEDLLFATYGYLDPFEMRAARTQYLLGNAETGDAILAAAAIAVGGLGPNLIGTSGAADFTRNFGMINKQYRTLGGSRIYDGYDPVTGYNLEIKTTTRGVVYPNAAIRQQLAVDMGSNVIWCFVDGCPSASLQNMLKAIGMPWVEWYR